MPMEDPALLRWLAARAQIIDCTVRFANAFDAQDWPALRACLAERVYTDYAQFRGTPPAWELADDYVAARRAGLAGLRTLHVLTNHEVALGDDRARCVSAYQIFRVRVEPDGGERRLDTAGRYEHELARGADGWRIERIRQTVVIQSGDRAIHGALRARPDALGGGG